MTAATVGYTNREHVATITLDRPERHNALSWQAGRDLLTAVERAAADPDVRAVVLTGAGRSFCVGADLAADPQTRTLRGGSVAEDVMRLRSLTRTVTLLHEMSKPTIAAINGACAGAGLSFALAADIRVATERAVFNTAFVAAGLSGDLGSAWLLTRAVGPARARQLLLLPDKLDAQCALRVGLIHEITNDLTNRVAALSARFAAAAPLAVAGAKQNLTDAASQPFGEYLRGETERMVRCAHSEDAREAAGAFLAKRTPRFVGR